MVCHPEVQKLAQEELDRVVRPHRLPDLTDRNKLLYITAVLYEIMRFVFCTPKRKLGHLFSSSIVARWQPVTPLGASLAYSGRLDCDQIPEFPRRYAVNFDRKCGEYYMYVQVRYLSCRPSSPLEERVKRTVDGIKYFL